MIQYVGCRICQGNKYIYTQNELGEYEVKICNCYEKYLFDVNINLQLLQAGIQDEKVFEFHLDRIVGTKTLQNVMILKEYVDNHHQQKVRHFYLYGDKSTQKSTVSKWLIKYALEKNFTCRYVFMEDLMNELSTVNFDNSGLVAEKISNYRTCKLLIIDESFCKERHTIYKSGFQIPALDSFLRKRLETNVQATIFVSNSPISKIADEGFNPYIQELINRNCELLLFNNQIH